MKSHGRIKVRKGEREMVEKMIKYNWKFGRRYYFNELENESFPSGGGC